MKKYAWEIRSAKEDDRCVSIFESLITTDSIKEILENALKNNAKNIYLDHCCLTDSKNPDKYWSEFENIDETYKLVEKYKYDCNISVMFVS